MKIRSIILALGMISAMSCTKSNEVVIYGGSSACATAAWSAAQKGSKVTIICPDVTIGGMTTGGLGQTDIGNKQAVTGLSRQFYRRLGEYYGKFEQWLFEPHVAENILLKYLDHPNITVMQGWYLDSVEKEGTRIRSITCTTEDGQSMTLAGDQFIDCTYEGDLMAKSGVSYVVGREGNEVYGETWDGWHMLDKHQFPDGVDPYVIPGKPESGLLWGISELKPHETGSGDDYVQAYNYRICLTDDPDNLIPIERPENYDSTKYELLVRVFDAQKDMRDINQYFIWSKMPNHKTDINNRGAFSTDMIGMNHSYPEASWPERRKILKAHYDYTIGLLYFYATDPRVPEELQSYVRNWGLPKDEYLRTNHWTHQLYVREARRLVGEYVATQADCENKVTDITDGIGYAAYQMDSHNTERLVIEKDGKIMVKNEGDVEKHGGIPYPISYRSLTPKRSECTNLLVPVCLSASHIAYGSIRMEPVFLCMGQVCGLAANMAGTGSVQEIDIKALQDILLNDPYLDGSEPETVIDEDSEYITGKDNWTVAKGGYGFTYLRYNGAPEDNHLAYMIPEKLDGKYDIYAFQQKHGCPVTTFTVEIDGKSSSIDFDRSSLLVEGQTNGEWVPLGTYDLKKGLGGRITFTSESGDVHADAVIIVKK